MGTCAAGESLEAKKKLHNMAQVVEALATGLAQMVAHWQATDKPKLQSQASRCAWRSGSMPRQQDVWLESGFSPAKRLTEVDAWTQWVLATPQQKGRTQIL